MRSFSRNPLALAILAASVVNAQNSSATTLCPVLDPDVDVNSLSNIALSSNVGLHYGSSSTVTPSNITLQMQYPTVLLEQIASISAVDCSATNVTVTFSTALGPNTTMDEWYDDKFVMVTNHSGDCNAENERG
jgi:hypothetical protein